MSTSSSIRGLVDAAFCAAAIGVWLAPAAAHAQATFVTRSLVAEAANKAAMAALETE